MSTRSKLTIVAVLVLLIAFICYRVIVSQAHEPRENDTATQWHPDDPSITKPHTPTSTTQPPDTSATVTDTPVTDTSITHTISEIPQPSRITPATTTLPSQTAIMLSDLPPGSTTSGSAAASQNHTDPTLGSKPTTTTSPTPSTTTSTTASQTYTVKEGDSLWSIAKQFYNDGQKYTLIQKANPGITPDLIKPGQTLVIPPLP